MSITPSNVVRFSDLNYPPPGPLPTRKTWDLLAGTLDTKDQPVVELMDHYWRLRSVSRGPEGVYLLYNAMYGGRR